MSQKSAIYWAVVRSWYSALHGFDIMRVTSEKYGSAFGSYSRGITRVRLKDIKAKCPTEDKAKEALNVIAMIYKNSEVGIEDAKRFVKRLELDRDSAVTEYLKGINND